MKNGDSIASIIADALGEGPWPSPFKKQTGDKRALAHEISAVDVHADQATADLKRARLTLGSLLIGQAAEIAFERIYSKGMQTSDIALRDDRVSRSDADYILVNGGDRPLYRLNIKLHGSLFRKADELVGLRPEDCFPLATYKIALALEKQTKRHLPFLFVVVTVPGLTAEETGAKLPSDLVDSLIASRYVFKAQKREIEERLIRYTQSNCSDVVQTIENRLEQGAWYVFSARRAHNLMKEMLFERVFALRTRNFNMAFRNAEIDMHLSFSQDMMTLQQFLAATREHSLSVIGSKIERGTI